MIVVDTNIVSYLLIEGDRTEVCRKVFLKDPEWAAPFLWRSEFRNVLTLHMRHAQMSLEGALERSQRAQSLFLNREFSVGSDIVLELTNRYPISAYDAEFVCLANKFETQLITTDKKVLAHFADVAIQPETFINL